MTTKQSTDNPFPALKSPRPVIEADGVVRYTWDDPANPGHDAWEHAHRKMAKYKSPALSTLIKDKRHHVNDQMRISRFLDGKDGGSISADLAFERMQDATLKDEVRQGWWDRHRQAMRIPNARAVDEKGDTAEGEMGNTLYDLLQASRKRAALPATDGEVRVLTTGEHDDHS